MYIWLFLPPTFLKTLSYVNCDSSHILIQIFIYNMHPPHEKKIGALVSIFCNG
jgi:hypothetical protein